MNLQKILKKNPTLFPFVNTSFALELPEMKTDKTIKLKYTKFYQLEYIGEVAERWDERDMVKNRADFIGLVLGLAKSFSNDFLYNQKEIFINKAAARLEKSFDLTSALSVLYFANEQGLDMSDSMESIYQGILKSEKEIEDTNELVFAIHLAVANKAYVHFQHKEADDQIWREMICLLLDQLELNLSSPHEDYPLLALLSVVYGALDKPKSKEFKTKGMVRYLQSISGLLKKEINEERSYSISEVLKIKREDVFIYNYLLVFECGHFREQDITEPGYERICKRYIEYQFLNEKTVSDAFLERLEEDKNRNKVDQYFDLSSLIPKLHRFVNMDNLHKFLDLANDKLMERVYPAHILLIQKDLVDEDRKKNIVTRLLMGDGYPVQRLSKEQFDYLQEKLKEYQANTGLEFKPNQNYVNLCIQYGHLSLDDIEKLKELEVIEYAVKYIFRQKDWNKLIEFLEKVNTSFHEVLWRYDYRFKEELKGDLLKRYYNLYINYMFYREPSKYAKRVYELLQDDSFVELFELTKEDVEDIEKTIYNNQLLSKYDAEELYRKYTPEEVLEQERLEKVKNEICGYSLYSLNHHFKEHLKDMKNSEIVRKAFVERLQLLRIERSFIDDFLLTFYKLKYHELLTEEESKTIENKAIEFMRYVA